MTGDAAAAEEAASLVKPADLQLVHKRCLKASLVV